MPELDKHPHYQNPTIVEALCEIHFRLSEGDRWLPSMPGALWKEIASDYPDIEPQTEMMMNIQVDQTGTAQPSITERKRFRFTHKSKSNLIQLSDGMVTYNVLSPYPGWETVSSGIKGTWANVRNVFKPSSIYRIGIRYINKIQRRSADELASYWLKETDFLPKRVLNSLPPFSARITARLSSTDRIVVSLGYALDDTPHKSIAFDIDCIRENELTPDLINVATAIDELHEQIWRIFSEAVSDNLEKLLRGEMP